MCRQCRAGDPEVLREEIRAEGPDHWMDIGLFFNYESGLLDFCYGTPTGFFPPQNTPGTVPLGLRGASPPEDGPWDIRERCGQLVEAGRAHGGPLVGHWWAAAEGEPGPPRPRHGAGIYTDSRLHGTCRAQLRSTPRASASAPGCSRGFTRAYPAPLLVARGAHCPVARGAHCPAAWRPRPRLAARSSRLAGPGAGSSSEPARG